MTASHKDCLSANAGHAQLFGDGDNDNFYGGKGDDIFDGGEGRDYLGPGSRTDKIDGEAELMAELAPNPPLTDPYCIKISG